MFYSTPKFRVVSSGNLQFPNSSAALDKKYAFCIIESSRELYLPNELVFISKKILWKHDLRLNKSYLKYFVQLFFLRLLFILLLHEKQIETVI